MSTQRRQRPWFVATVAGFLLLLTSLAPPQTRLELGAIVLSVGLLACIMRMGSPVAELWRFIAGPVVFLLTALAGDMADSMLPHGTIVQGATLGLRALGLGWSLLALARLGRGAWSRHPWRTIVPSLVAYLLTAVNAGSGSIIPFLAVLASWGIPTHWLPRPPSRTAQWQTAFLVLGAPLALFFAAEINASGADLSIAGGGPRSEGLMGNIRTLLLIFWLTLPPRLLLRGFRHLMLGLSIRMRLVLTYFFSTLLPGLLALVLVGVVVFAGIGTLRARVASNLIMQDLEDLTWQLDHLGIAGSPVRDSVTAGLYAVGGADTVTAVPIPPEFPLLADSLMPRQLGTLQFSGLNEPVVAAPAGSWIRLAQRGPLVLPDTLRMDPEAISTVGRSAALVPTGGGQAAFVAAASVEGSRLVRIVARPLNEEVAEGYKRIVGADLIISPTASMLFTSEGSEVSISPGGTRGAVASIATRVSGEGRGLFHRPIRQGICELQATKDSAEVSHLRGVVVVRTTVAGLVGSLFTTQGINLAVVVVEGVLAALILIAWVFSTVIGFSLNGTITSSMAALKHGAERLSQGDLDVQVQMPARGEMGRMADSFNRLASDLKRMVQQVAEKERLDRELQIARQIQVNLLPGRLPQVEDIELAATSRPAREVAGDYYDALMVEPGRLVLVVADVSGKGVAAAMLMSNLQSALHVLLSQNLALEVIVGRLNSLIHVNSPPEMFITFFIAVVDPHRLELDYVNAGHDKPLLIRGDETVRLGPCGLLLGIFPEASYVTGHLDLQAGDLLALYSDGVTEAMNPADEEFGVDRLEEALRSATGSDASRILATVVERVQMHVGSDAAPMDDLTMLIMRVKGKAGAREA